MDGHLFLVRSPLLSASSPTSKENEDIVHTGAEQLSHRDRRRFGVVSASFPRRVERGRRGRVVLLSFLVISGTVADGYQPLIARNDAFANCFHLLLAFFNVPCVFLVEFHNSFALFSFFSSCYMSSSSFSPLLRFLAWMKDIIRFIYLRFFFADF